MRSGKAIVIGFLLSIVTIFILSYSIEQGDINAVSMYFVVFLIPCLILTILNGLYLSLLEKLHNIRLKSVLCLIPIIGLGVMSISDELTIPEIDGNLVFASMVATIALGLTNVLWMITAITRSSL